MHERCEPMSGPHPPAVSPDRFEDFPVFRETFLSVFTEPTYNGAPCGRWATSSSRWPWSIAATGPIIPRA